jgi:hypothetical protein
MPPDGVLDLRRHLWTSQLLPLLTDAVETGKDPAAYDRSLLFAEHARSGSWPVPLAWRYRWPVGRNRGQRQQHRVRRERSPRGERCATVGPNRRRTASLTCRMRVPDPCLSPRLVCIPTTHIGPSVQRYRSVRATEARGRTSAADPNSPTDGVEQPGVRKKSLYTGDISDTNLSPGSGQTVNVHVIGEWAKVALDTSGTSEARMSMPVWPSVLTNSDHNNSNRLPSQCFDATP